VHLVEASHELALDAVARHNRSRPKAAALALDPGGETAALAVGTLPGDGKSAPRGVVAPLASRARGLRGVYVYRGMQPLGPIDDRCAWPTAAVIDDARVRPNRVWDGPVYDDLVDKVRDDIDRLSDMLLTQGIVAPKDALTSTRIGKEAARKYSKQGVLVRGRLWLVGVPLEGGIVVRATESNLALAPIQVRDGRFRALPVSGELRVCGAEHDPDAATVERVVMDLARDFYPRLLRQLARRRTADPDRAGAHLAYGMALGAIDAAHLEGTTFACFAPAPIDAATLAGLLRANSEVTWVGADQPHGTELALVDDGSVVGRTLMGLLGPRLRRLELETVAESLVAEAPPEPTTAKPLPVASTTAPRMHPLETLAMLCQQRLAALDLGLAHAMISVVRGVSPLARWDGGTVYLAGDHPRLRQVFEELTHETALAAPMLDLLVAHVVTVLNRAPTVVTDATEERALLGLLEPSS